MKRLSLCVLATMVFLCGCQRDISGTYLAGDSAGVCWLQLVRTPDNHLTGQLIATLLKSDGSVERNSVSLAGAIEGNNITLSGSRFFGLQTITLFGTRVGNTLSLTGIEPKSVTFTRAALTEYQAQVGKIDARSQVMRAQKISLLTRLRTHEAAKNFVASVDQLISKMQRFDSEADLHLRRFPSAEENYHTITQQVTGYVSRERQLANTLNSSNARSQLSNAATEASFTTDQMHDHAQTLQTTLDTNVNPIAEEATALEQQCRQFGSESGSLTPLEDGAHTVACSRLSIAVAPFRQKYNAVSAGLAHLEQVYKHERNSQQELLESASRLE
jgi:hypothetical protein